jgi:hypothetical protein
MAQGKHPPGPPMDLANMRRQGVHHLIAYCLNGSCRQLETTSVGCRLTKNTKYKPA